MSLDVVGHTVGTAELRAPALFLWTTVRHRLVPTVSNPLNQAAPWRRGLEPAAHAQWATGVRRPAAGRSGLAARQREGGSPTVGSPSTDDCRAGLDPAQSATGGQQVPHHRLFQRQTLPTP